MLDITCESSAKQTIHMLCQAWFPLKNTNTMLWKCCLPVVNGALRVKGNGYTCKGDRCQKVSPFLLEGVYSKGKEFAPEGLLFPFRTDPFSEGVWFSGKQTEVTKIVSVWKNGSKPSKCINFH